MKTTLKNSENFIYSVSKKKMGFKTPKGYFNSLETKINKSVLAQEFLTVTENAFKVPNTYFNTLETAILKKTTLKTSAKKVSIKQKIIKLIPFAAAASIVLFIGLNTSFFSTNNSINFNELTAAEIESWLLIDTENTIEQVFFENEEYIETDETPFITTEISIEEIESYLNEEEGLLLFLENN